MIYSDSIDASPPKHASARQFCDLSATSKVQQVRQAVIMVEAAVQTPAIPQPPAREGPDLQRAEQDPARADENDPRLIEAESEDDMFDEMAECEDFPPMEQQRGDVIKQELEEDDEEQMDVEEVEAVMPPQQHAHQPAENLRSAAADDDEPQEVGEVRLQPVQPPETYEEALEVYHRHFPDPILPGIGLGLRRFLFNPNDRRVPQPLT